jgi:hypothetical protein
MTCARNILFLLLITALAAVGPAHACAPPERPFLPQSQDDKRTYADLIREDFETYIADVQNYFRCVDEQRARTFVEAREVSEEYGRFLNALH